MIYNNGTTLPAWFLLLGRRVPFEFCLKGLGHEFS